MAKRSYAPGVVGRTGYGRHHQRFLDGEDSPRAFLERCIERIESRERKVRAFVALDIKRARADADAAAARYAAGRPRSRIDGCPVGVKDIIHTRRMATSMGSRIYAGWKAPGDAACVAALKHAGAIVLGKTHTTEFAVGESAPTTNPWKRSRTPGGSSSGSAAAVGAGMLPLALGTQTMGSILRPASYCGAVGYKPSAGALPLVGVHSLSRTLDHVGPIAATVEDAWEAAMLMQRAYGGDAAIGRAWLDPVVASRPRRLARIDHLVGADEREPGVQAVFDAWLRELDALGVEVVRVEPASELGQLLQQANAVCLDILRYEMRYPMGLYLERRPRSLGPRIREHLSLAESIDVDRYRARLAERARARAAVGAQDVDGFVLPSACGAAPRGLAFTGSRTMLAPWSVIGGPAWSLPLLAVDGLPLGAQLAGAPERDTRLAAVAHWLMDRMPGAAP